MASTYSDLKLQLMATGENSGTWGDVTNVNLGTALEEAITGSANVAFSSADVTLPFINNNETQAARNLRLNLTGTSGGARNLIVPAIEKIYIINNGLADTVTVKNAAGTGIAVPAGKTMYVFNDGTNVVDAITHLTSLTTGALVATTADINGGSIDGTTVGAAVASTGAFTTLGSNSTTILNGTTIPASKTLVDTDSSQTITNKAYNGSIGATTPSTGAFTDFTASGTADFTSTAAVKLPVGTEAQRPTPAAGMLRFNDDTDEFEGYNGTAWSSVGGSAISNDTSTSTDVFPLFADATSGTASSVFTSNAKLLYKPSTGEFKAEALVATNGIVVNSATIDTNYTIAAGTHGHSVGPLTVDATVTVDGVWLIS